MENIKTKKFFSIKAKITISIVLFVVLALGLVFSVSFLNTKKVMRDDLNLRLLNMVNLAVLQVDVDKHDTLIEASDEESQNYKDIKKKLQDARDNSTDIRYIYTLRENENQEVVFVVDAEEDPENISHLGDVYEEASESYPLNDFSNINKPVVEKGFTTDKWGTWLSGYAPFYDKDGKRQGVLGIDISASDIVLMEKKMLITYLISFLIAGIFSIILGLILSRVLTKSISFLTSIITNTKNTEAPTSNDEVTELAGVLKTTLNKINTTQKNSEEEVSSKTKMLEKMNSLMIGRELEMIKLKKEIASLKANKDLSENNK